MTPATSVIIPCYNAEAYLTEALDSVRKQTRPPLEIVLIDDGSAVPVAIPEGWTGPEIRVIRTENRGLAAARNRGLKEARGEFIALLDADDAWAPRKLELQEDALRTSPEAVACYTRCVDAPGFFGFGPYPPVDVSHDEFMLVMWYHSVFPPSSILVRRSACEAAGPFKEGMLNGEDVEWWFRLMRLGRFVQVPEELTYYRQHAGQLTKNLVKKFIGGRQARREVIRLNADRLVAAGLRPDKLWDAHRNEILLVYYRRHFSAARRLLWSYWLEHPLDIGILFRAVVSLFPQGLITRLRGRLPDRPVAEVPESSGPQRGWKELRKQLGPVIRPRLYWW
jgi:glycosyltransferase involved in cell wall biosynthesis